MLGYCDGDGCWTITTGYPKFNVVGSKSFIEEYQKRLCKHTGLNLSKIQTAKKAYCFEYTGLDKIKKIGDFFYKKNEFNLIRKHQKYLSYFEKEYSGNRN